MLGGEVAQAVQAHHFTIIMYQLCDHTHRGQPGKTAQVHSSFRVTWTFPHSTINHTQRENMPGLVIQAGVLLGSARMRAVRARSVADMPVLTPIAASQETVYAVPLASSLISTMGGSTSASARSPSKGTQMTPDEYGWSIP